MTEFLAQSKGRRLFVGTLLDSLCSTLDFRSFFKQSTKKNIPGLLEKTDTKYYWKRGLSSVSKQIEDTEITYIRCYLAPTQT